MNKITARSRTVARRVNRVRSKVRKTKGCARLSVHSTGKHIYAQVINDVEGVTLVAASSCEKDILKLVKTGGNVSAAREVGRVVAERALAAGISAVVFDRGGKRYHGRIAAVATAARGVGLIF